MEHKLGYVGVMPVACSVCQGMGNWHEYAECGRCRGTGEIPSDDGQPNGRCPECSAERTDGIPVIPGKTYVRSVICHICRGEGTYYVKPPKGETAKFVLIPISN